MAAAIAYREPSTLVVLIQSSFLLVLSFVNFLFNRTLNCGLVGQIFVGVAWGSPGGNLLGAQAETLITQLGYLGLILLVYEGGLSSNISAVKANLVLSLEVAITGICLPVALSFALLSLANATSLQAFAAGAALCSTSLGTTFTVLSTSGLTTTRLGTILTTAAMLDDVVGLIMVQVISNLGKTSEFSAVIVVRPIAVSVGLVVILLLFCRFLVKPVTQWMNTKECPSIMKSSNSAFLVHTAILFALVVGSSYAGTSNLFAAYLAGASISWWDSEAFSILKTREPPVQTNITPKMEISPTDMQDAMEDATSNDNTSEPKRQEERDVPKPDPSTTSGAAIYHTYYAPAVNRILKPFFFASIGFAIPITQIFSGAIVWRGLVYTLLMLLGKFSTGAWLLLFSTPTIEFPPIARIYPRPIIAQPQPHRPSRPTSTNPYSEARTAPNHPPTNAIFTPPKPHLQDPFPTLQTPQPEAPQPPTPTSSGPLSLYPPAILGLAMVSRGEIGFLIASIAESEGIFPASAVEGKGTTMFLIIIWAITLCTIIGPMSVGLLVKRVRTLQGGKCRKVLLEPL